MVQKGKFSTGMALFVRTLKVVDFPLLFADDSLVKELILAVLITMKIDQAIAPIQTIQKRNKSAFLVLFQIRNWPTLNQ